MRSSGRTFIAFLAFGMALVVLSGMARGLAIALPPDESPAMTTAAGPLIISGQKPRIQDFPPGGTAAFTVTITNTGGIPFQTVSVSDAVSPDCNRADLGSLAAGGSLSYTCTRSGVTGSFLNELQVNGTTADATVISHRSNAFVKVLNQELRITKTPREQIIRQGATAFFTITVYNTSDFLMDLKEVNDSLVEDCNLIPVTTVNLEPGESIDYPCSFGDVQTPLATVATVRTTNLLGDVEYVASDVAWVDLLNLQATLLPQPTTVPEPGDLVTYTVNLVNPGSVPVTLVGLTTNKYGNILDPGNSMVEAVTNSCLPQPLLPTLMPFNGTYQCSFVAPAEGQPSDFSVILTATGRGPNDAEVTATTNATVVITNVPASMKVTLSADPPFVNPPSQTVSFSVLVENTSGADAITITGMTDEFLGSLNGRGTCEVPIEGLPAGFSYQCRFSDTVGGQVGQQKSRTITVNAISDDLTGETLTVNEVVTVGITDQPTQYNFMPNVNDHSLDRTSCARPYPLSLNTQYFFRPPNKYNSALPVEQREQDYFTFELTQSGSVRVELTNFVPRKGQLIIRPHVPDSTTPCGSPLGRNPDEALNRVVDLGTQPAGRYYIQIINDGPSNVPDLYGLIVRVN